MKTAAVAKRELRRILYNRRFMVGFVVQLVLLLAVVPSMATVLEEGSLSLPSPTLKGYVPLGLVDRSVEARITKEELRRNDLLDVRGYPSLDGAFMDLEKGRLAAVVVLPEGYDETGFEPLMVKVWTSASSVKRESALGAIDDSLAFASSRIEEKRRKALGVGTFDPISLERHFLRPVVIEKKGARFSSFFLGYLIPMVLFFPIFMAGGMVVDSVVGERETGALESLLAAPLGRRDIVLGKFLGIFGFISLQCLLWLALLVLRGIPVANFWAVLLLLAAVNGAVISLAVLLAVYSTGTKGANISLMFMYVAVFTVLVTTLSMEFFSPREFFNLVPFIIVSRLSVGEAVSPLLYLAHVLLLSWAALLILATAGRLLERDDVALGVKPGLFTLFSDGAGGIMRRFSRRPMLASSLLAASSALISIPLALLVEVSLGLAVLYLFGLGQPAVVLMVFLFAATEELVKPLPVFALKREVPEFLDGRRGLLLGLLSGIGFSLLETLFMALATLFYMPSMVVKIIALRTGTTLLVHALGSAIMGYGIARSRGRLETLPFLILATALHAAFNLLVVSP